MTALLVGFFLLHNGGADWRWWTALVVAAVWDITMTTGAQLLVGRNLTNKTAKILAENAITSEVDRITKSKLNGQARIAWARTAQVRVSRFRVALTPTSRSSTPEPVALGLPRLA